jgi:hypothetical protein
MFDSAKTTIKLPYKIDVKDCGNAIIQKIQNELEEGPRKSHYLTIFQAAIEAFENSIVLADGLSEAECKKYYQIETTHPVFYNWLAYYLTLQDPNKISLVLDLYASEKYGPTENFNNAIEFLLITCLEHVPFNHQPQDDAVVKWVREKNYQLNERTSLVGEVKPNKIDESEAEIIEATISEKTKKKAQKMSRTARFQDSKTIPDIGISKEWQGNMCHIFINYLDNVTLHRKTFIEVMKGRHLNTEHRIFLNMQANLFCQALKEMRAPGHYITSTKKLIAKWIHTNFCFRVKSNIKAISESYCLSLLTSDRDAPDPKDKIKIDFKRLQSTMGFQDNPTRPSDSMV